MGWVQSERRKCPRTESESIRLRGWAEKEEPVRRRTKMAVFWGQERDTLQGGSEKLCPMQRIRQAGDRVDLTPRIGFALVK